jgi:hypothetical protein
MRLLFISLLLATTLVAAENNPRGKELKPYAAQLAQAILKENKGPITDEQFCRLAAQLLKFLEGPPRQDEEPSIRIMKGAAEGKIILYAGYSRGFMEAPWYYFTFIRKTGVLDEALVLSY